MSKKMVENYEIQLKDQLGEGGFGTVYMCINKLNGEKYAIKAINKKILTNDQYKLNALKSQIKLLYNIKADHIVGFKDVLQTQRNYYIVMELCHGDLRNLIKKRHIFPIPEAISIMTQVLEAFYHIITLGYVHRDLKPENILLKDDLIKVGDFGLSKRYHNRKLLDTAVGTISYQAPQVLLNDRYSYKCDIWAFGLIFFELLYGKLPYKATSPEGLIKEITSGFSLKFPEQPEIPGQIKQIIKRCLMVKEEDRADWDYLYEHPIFRQNVPSISNLKKRLKYTLGLIRRQISQSNIDLNTFFDMIKGKNQNKEVKQVQFGKMLKTIVPELSGDQISYIFSQFDENSDGTISIEEFRDCLKHNEVSFSAITRDQIQNQIIKCEGEQIDPLEEFHLNRMEEVYKKLILYAMKNKLQNIPKLYLQKDKNEEGLDEESFFVLLNEICPQLNKEECILLFEKFDDNKDKRISYGQFYKYLCKVLGRSFKQSYIL